MNRIDPDGRDYIITINRDKDGNITGIIFSATVYITGDGANPERAVELNALAKKTYKSKEINGVSVGFDVQYKYDKEVTGIGDYGSEKVPYNSGINMLDLKNEKSDRKNGIDSNVQTEVEGSSPYHGSIYNSREKEISNYDIMHETMHFFGFDDRYNAKTFIYNIGYKNDIMGSRNLNINSSHYSTMYNNVMTYSEIQRGKYPYMKQLNNLYQSLRIPNPFLTTKYSKDTMIE